MLTGKIFISSFSVAITLWVGTEKIYIIVVFDNQQ